MRYLKSSFITLALCLTLATQAAASGVNFPLPIEGPMVYSNCPQPVRYTAAVGMVLMVPTIIVGTVAGLLASPFYGLDIALPSGIFGGAVIGNIVGTAITGAPAYGIYRLFAWDGCK